MQYQETESLKMRNKKPEQRKGPTGTTLKVKLIPKSSRNQIEGKSGDTYRIKVTAPPVDGKANEALIDLLAGRLGVAKRNIRIVSGASSRMKTLLISDIPSAEVSKRLDG